jgi:hypothetical protein
LITQRSTDGYVNATALCKANGKRWRDYARRADAKHYLKALTKATGLPAGQLVTPKAGVGTSVHPQVALDLARWLNPAFGIWSAEPGIPVSKALPPRRGFLLVDRVFLQKRRRPGSDRARS